MILWFWKRLRARKVSALKARLAEARRKGHTLAIFELSVELQRLGEDIPEWGKEVEETDKFDD